MGEGPGVFESARSSRARMGASPRDLGVSFLLTSLALEKVPKYISIGWIIHPTMRRSEVVAIVATFSALIVGSDFVLSPLYNVKLLDTLVFVSAYLFGFRTGAFVGIVSETVWSVVSPMGMAGSIAPFLIVGEILFALAGWGASRVWGSRFKLVSFYPAFFGATMAICAFLWDLETNLAIALLQYWPSPTAGEYFFTAFGPMTIPFILAHEVSDLTFGLVLAPLFIVLIPRVIRGPL